MSRRWLSILFAVVTALLSSVATAQETAGGGDGLPAADAQAIVEILKDDAKREALIARLEGAAENAAEPAAEEAPPSVGRRIAEATKGAAERAADSASALVGQFSAASGAFDDLSSGELEILYAALRALALVIVVTVVVYLALRALARRIFRSLGQASLESGVAKTVAMLLAAMVIDAFVVLLAAGAGAVAALYFSGVVGEIGVRQSLYLNAFVIVGMVKVLIRGVLSPATAALRFVSIPDAGAKTMALWFGVIASVLGYGQLLIVPIVNRQASMAAGRGVSTLLALLAIAIAAALVIRGRKPVARWMLGEDPDDKPGAMRFLARNWHAPTLLYLAVLFIVVAARPDGLIWPVLVNSAQVLGVVVAGVLLSGLITRSIRAGVHLPQNVNQRLPLLERRLNAFVPRALQVMRALIVIGVVVFAANALDLIDMGAWFAGEAGARLSGSLATVVFMLVAAFAIWLGLSSWVDYRLNPDFGSKPTSREETLLSLLKNAATIVILVITVMFVLSELGVDIAPLIASAGVLGLAIGFGAQKMVQDIITGIFIQFENAMNVGDVVTLGGTTGVVEKLTIRSVSLRDVNGTFHIIPFSSVDLVSNYMRDYGNYVCDMGIAYRENIDEAKQAMHDAFDKLKASETFGQHVIGDLQWFGVQALADSAVILRARIRCAPGQQWGVGREYQEICKKLFDERDIEIPFPHQTIYFGVDKKGEAPPAPVRIEEKPA